MHKGGRCRRCTRWHRCRSSTRWSLQSILGEAYAIVHNALSGSLADSMC